MNKDVIFSKTTTVASQVTMSFGGNLVLLQYGDEVEYTVRRTVKRKLDWSKVPRGTLITVNGSLEYFNNVCPKSGLIAYYSAVDDFSKQIPSGIHYTDEASLAPTEQQPWMSWFGGECPLPEGVLIDVKFRELLDSGKKFSEAVKFRWSHLLGKDENAGGSDIIAYKIVGLAEGWIH